MAMKRLIRRMKPRVMGMLAVVTVIFGLIGSYIYYAPIVDSGRLASVVVYSAVKLYLFAPTVPLDKGPLIYEIAKWLAPICTAAAVVQMFEMFIRRNLIGLYKRFGHPVYVFGLNDHSKILIEDVIKSGKHVVLVTGQEVNRETKLAFLRKGVDLFDRPFPQITEPEGNKRTSSDLLWYFKRMRIRRADAIVLFEESDSANFSNLIALMQYFESASVNAKRIKCSMQCLDYGMNKVVSAYVDEHNATLKQIGLPIVLDVALFNFYDIAAYQLFSHDLPIFTYNIETCDREHADVNCPKSWDVHLLILGFGNAGESILTQTLNYGVLHEKSRIVIDVFDEKCAQKLSCFKAKYRSLLSAAREMNLIEIRSHEFEIRSEECDRDLLRLAEDKENPVTYAAICFGSGTLSFLSMVKIVEMFPNIPTAIRLDVDRVVENYIRSNQSVYHRVVPFGIERAAITANNVLRSEVGEKAERTHQAYQKLAGGGDWIELNLFKKGSNIAQVIHAPYKLTRLGLYLKYYSLDGQLRENPIQSETEVLAASKEALKVCRDQVLAPDAENPEAVIGFLDRYPIIQEILRTEHLRWCNYLFLHGYTYGETKSEDHKIHNCLLPRWDDLVNAHPEMLLYDLIALAVTATEV